MVRREGEGHGGGMTPGEEGGAKTTSAWHRFFSARRECSAPLLSCRAHALTPPPPSPLLPSLSPHPHSLRIVIRHLAKPTASATLGALADLLGGEAADKRDVAALAIQAVASDERLAGPGKGIVDAALVEVLLPRMIAIASAKVGEERRGAGPAGGERGAGDRGSSFFFSSRYNLSSRSPSTRSPPPWTPSWRSSPATATWRPPPTLTWPPACWRRWPTPGRAPAAGRPPAWPAWQPPWMMSPWARPWMR